METKLNSHTKPNINQQMNDETLYSCLRDEMIEIFTRQSNTNNFSLILISALLVASKTAYDEGVILLGLMLTFGSFLFLCISKYYSTAYEEIAKIALQLFALEEKNQCFHWNEHYQFKNYKRQPKINRLFWDMPFMINLVIFFVMLYLIINKVEFTLVFIALTILTGIFVFYSGYLSIRGLKAYKKTFTRDGINDIINWTKDSNGKQKTE